MKTQTHTVAGFAKKRCDIKTTLMWHDWLKLAAGVLPRTCLMAGRPEGRSKNCVLHRFAFGSACLRRMLGLRPQLPVLALFSQKHDI